MENDVKKEKEDEKKRLLFWIKLLKCLKEARGEAPARTKNEEKKNEDEKPSIWKTTKKVLFGLLFWIGIISSIGGIIALTPLSEKIIDYLSRPPTFTKHWVNKDYIYVSNPIVDGNEVYALTNNAELYKLDISNGASNKIGNKAIDNPSYLAKTDNFICCRTKNEIFFWGIGPKSGINGSILVKDGILDYIAAVPNSDRVVVNKGSDTLEIWGLTTKSQYHSFTVNTGWELNKNCKPLATDNDDIYVATINEYGIESVQANNKKIGKVFKIDVDYGEDIRELSYYYGNVWISGHNIDVYQGGSFGGKFIKHPIRLSYRGEELLNAPTIINQSKNNEVVFITKQGHVYIIESMVRYVIHQNIGKNMIAGPLVQDDMIITITESNNSRQLVAFSKQKISIGKAKKEYASNIPDGVKTTTKIAFMHADNSTKRFVLNFEGILRCYSIP